MTKTRDELLALLNCDGALVNLQKLVREELLPPTGDDVNNHIHTTYSFSPYSPTAAVYFARIADEAEQSSLQISVEEIKNRFSLVKQDWNN